MKRTSLWPAAAGLLLAAPALAAEEGGGGGPFAGNVGNALWTLLVFGLVVFVLGKYAWRPILAGLAAREAYIRAALESAKRDRDEAEARLKEYADKLVEARSEATAIVDEARRDADEARRKVEAEARAEAQALVERARREIGIAQESATQQLYALTARLSTQLAGRLLEREINPQDHERLIRESIERFSSEEN